MWRIQRYLCPSQDSRAAFDIPEMYHSDKIQVKAGRARGNNTGQRMGIYFSLKIHGIVESLARA